DDLLEASVPEKFTDASTSLAVDWTDLDSFSRPPPRGTSDCADPEASWGHRKNNLLRSQDELFYGWYLSAGIMVPEENGPAVPEFARRATVSSCRHGEPLLPVHAPHADRPGTAGPHRHQLASRGLGAPDRRTRPLQARQDHLRRPRRLPPRRLPCRHGQDPLPAAARLDAPGPGPA